MKLDVAAFEEMMKKGYEEMAELNKEIANESLHMENEADEIINNHLANS